MSAIPATPKPRSPSGARASAASRIASAPRPLAAVAGTLALAVTLSACGGTGTAASDEETVTVYSADGLKGDRGDGWYDRQFKAFEEKTGIEVKYVEGGSGEMVQRAVREKNNTQADVMVTLPPFIQQADRKGLLTPYEPRGSDQVPASEKSARGTWTGVVKNYFGFVRNTEELTGGSAPTTWNDLLDPRYRGKLQYSTPGVAGDGTAMLVKAMHDFGGKKPAMEYFRKLQKNNVGPSSSTSKLAPKVDKGELLVANGDVQMNYAQSKSMPNLGIWFPAAEKGQPGTAGGTGKGGEAATSGKPAKPVKQTKSAEPAKSAKPTTFALPYAAGLLRDAPSAENGKKLLDFLLSERAQREVPSVAGGFTVREDVEVSGEDAAAL